MTSTYPLCITMRYVHNLLVMHFNVGESIAFSLNNKMRSYLDLRNLCITMARQYSYRTTYIEDDNIPKFSFSKGVFRLDLIVFHNYFELNARTGNEPFEWFRIYPDHANVVKIRNSKISNLSERQFCFEMTKMFEKVT